ncbi:uncharacterized protein LOC124264103 [Haliotis rubra]|uniref:uncharacterized protein LOC124264103 n=1 Tax=Haliotis rubra TaxID=36100 RepID=UPI001EE6367F|nr:uncharacterized protein LOC124264103 [Haliotis rubra]
MNKYTLSIAYPFTSSSRCPFYSANTSSTKPAAIVCLFQSNVHISQAGDFLPPGGTIALSLRSTSQVKNSSPESQQARQLLSYTYGFMRLWLWLSEVYTRSREAASYRG